MKSVVAITYSLLATLDMDVAFRKRREEPLNVMGQPLKPCSTKGTAMTGFERDGTCFDAGNDDEGSHHICIKMKSDFCTVTRQPDWCTKPMPCMGDSKKECPIKNWCVCQWAFSGYIKTAGGCDKIVDVDCGATNMAARKAYEADPQFKEALECLQKKCKFSSEAPVEKTDGDAAAKAGQSKDTPSEKTDDVAASKRSEAKETPSEKTDDDIAASKRSEAKEAPSEKTEGGADAKEEQSKDTPSEKTEGDAAAKEEQSKDTPSKTTDDGADAKQNEAKKTPDGSAAWGHYYTGMTLVSCVVASLLRHT